MNMEERAVIKFVENILTEIIQLQKNTEKRKLIICGDILYKLRKHGISEAEEEIKFYKESFEKEN
jgi:hypothetical protein